MKPAVWFSVSWSGAALNPQRLSTLTRSTLPVLQTSLSCGYTLYYARTRSWVNYGGEFYWADAWRRGEEGQSALIHPDTFPAELFPVEGVASLIEAKASDEGLFLRQLWAQEISDRFDLLRHPYEAFCNEWMKGKPHRAARQRADQELRSLALQASAPLTDLYEEENYE